MIRNSVIENLYFVGVTMIKKSKLVLETFDANMKKVTIIPRCLCTEIDFHIEYYDKDILKSVIIIFENVIAIDFEINLFDNPIGSELSGLYEILDNSAKNNMIEKVFQNRLNKFLDCGDYHYDKYDEGNILNYRGNLNRIKQETSKYHLYEQQSIGGVYTILSESYVIKDR